LPTYFLTLMFNFKWNSLKGGRIVWVHIYQEVLSELCHSTSIADVSWPRQNKWWTGFLLRGWLRWRVCELETMTYWSIARVPTNDIDRIAVFLLRTLGDCEHSQFIAGRQSSWSWVFTNVIFDQYQNWNIKFCLVTTSLHPTVSLKSRGRIAVRGYRILPAGIQTCSMLVYVFMCVGFNTACCWRRRKRRHSCTDGRQKMTGTRMTSLALDEQYLTQATVSKIIIANRLIDLWWHSVISDSFENLSGWYN
jgi:hypothetical protein